MQMTEGNVVEWLDHQTWNPEVTGSGPAPTSKVELFLGRP